MKNDEVITRQMIVSEVDYSPVTRATGVLPETRTVKIYGRIPDLSEAVQRVLGADKDLETALVTDVRESKIMWGITFDDFIRYGREVQVKPSRLKSRSKKANDNNEEE